MTMCFRKYKIVLGFLMLVLLQSCFVAKKYERPELVTENLYRTDQLSQDSTSLGMVSWKEFFNDPVLKQHIENALTNNIDIRIALQQIITSEAYLKQGKAGNYPKVNTNGTITRIENPENSLFGQVFNEPVDQFELTANLSWEIDIWGKIRSNKRAFEATYLQSLEAHKAIKSQLIASLAITYYQLLALDEQLHVINETIKNRDESLKTTKALKDAGLVTEVAVQQTAAQMYNAQVLKIDIENSIRVLENAFSILLGVPAQEVARTNLKEQEFTSELITGVPYLLLQNRPDVTAAEYRLVNAFELTNLARSNFYPSVTLGATLGYQSIELSNLLDAGSFFKTLIAGFVQPILNGRKVRTQFEVSKAQQEQALLEYKRILLVAGQEVSDALYDYDAVSKKILVKEQEYEAYKKATEFSEALVVQGLANYLEVLTARENELASELSLIDNKYLRFKAVVTLYESLGGGWE